MARTNKRELLENLRVLLREAIALREAGVAYPKLARAHGYVDGYMRALLETGVTTQRELLQLVGEVRTTEQGPATREVEPEVDTAVA